MRGLPFKFALLGAVLLLLISAYYWADNTSVNEEKIRVIGVFCIVNLIYIYYSWYRCQGSFLNGYIIFVTAFYVFNLGQPILKVFDYVDPYYDLLDSSNKLQISIDTYYQSIYISTVSILFMHFGALTSLGKDRTAIFIRKVDEETETNMIKLYKKVNAIKKISLILLVISFPFWFYETIQLISFSVVYGYGGELIDVKSKIPSFVRILSDYYEPSLLCLYFCSEYLKKKQYVLLFIILLTVIIPPLVIGGRSQAVIAVAMVAIVHYLFYKVKTKRLLLMGVVVYFSLFVLFLVKKTRGSTGNTIETYSELLSREETTPISTVLSEMGHSMYPLAATMEIVPEREDYRYGSTYLWGLTTLIPNLGFWERHPGVENANLGEWLMKEKNLNFGPGYSITAEAYINFGYLGLIFFYIFGFLLAKYCKYINKKYIVDKPFLIIITLVFLWFSIKTVRNSFLGIVRAFFYVSLPMYWAFSYYYYKSLNKR